MDSKQTKSLTNLGVRRLSSMGINSKPTIVKRLNGEYENLEWLKNINYPDHIMEKFDISDDYTIDEFINFKYHLSEFGFPISSILDVPKVNNDKNEVWCFGCSFTQGTGVPAERNWPSILQRYTSKKVVNFGIGGAGPMTAWRLIKGWIDTSTHKPDSILIYGWFPARFEVEDNEGNPVLVMASSYKDDLLRHPTAPLNEKKLTHQIEKSILQSDEIYRKYINQTELYIRSLDINYHFLDIESDNLWRWDVPSFGRDFNPKFNLTRQELFDGYDIIDNWQGQMVVHPGPKHHKKIAEHFSKYI